MWLINTHSFRLEWRPDERTVEHYAILSHTWSTDDEEVTFQDMQDLSVAMARKGFHKIDRTCRQARSDGLRYAWVDSCCINRDASAELSEAINSMFRWYEKSRVCYVYLSDYSHTIEGLDRSNGRRTFGLCKWFTRGWTLQELIAPDNLKFFNSTWDFIGDKSSLVDQLSRITGIELGVLNSLGSAKHHALRTTSVAARMSWASQRRTTRKEDEAYALMGMFHVSMPLVYGEGKDAFRRLQEQILARFTDHSILLWRASPAHMVEPRALAPSPAVFRGSGQVIQSFRSGRAPAEFTLTSKGIRTLLPILRLEGVGSCAVLCCRYADDLRGPILLPLIHLSNEDSGVMCVSMQPVLSGTGERFPVLPILGNTSQLADIPSKTVILIESSVGCPDILQLVQRATVIFKLSKKFIRAFAVNEVNPDGKFNQETQTLSWLASAPARFEAASGSITWVNPEGKGIKLLLALTHRSPDKFYEIEAVEVRRTVPCELTQDTTDNSVSIIRRLGTIQEQNSYNLDVGVLEIKAEEAMLLRQRIVYVSMSLWPTERSSGTVSGEEETDAEPSPHRETLALPYRHRNSSPRASPDGTLTPKPRL